ncbi:MAG TPA: RNA polymerase sigma factor [Spirochaetota bacterium]|nr:RNA polymerase sigma factor [Spirochaetota bacterium]HPI87972.1 RNA polymerase sigma factor [Spirochaetota bacterium]HPR46683.1 RNA polymerase sigma factor [Spirochaetota bacterium]
MYNPFIENKNQNEDDNTLIEEALQGKEEALEKLILRHQAWIYNIAFKMVMDHDDACDITQEILVKVITKLANYNPLKAAFRTWLYRIVANHVLTMQTKKFEHRIHDFDTYVGLIDNIPDHRNFAHPEAILLEEELKTGCMMGMLMCLDRRERLIFLLGAVFNVTDVVGSEIMEISRDNFRKILSRSRSKVYAYMNGQCGHVNPDNPCRCSLKVKSFFDLGMMDPSSLRYHKPDHKKIKDLIETHFSDFTESFYEPFLEHFRSQPFYDPPDMVRWLRNMLQHDEFKTMFNIH